MISNDPDSQVIGYMLIRVFIMRDELRRDALIRTGQVDAGSSIGGVSSAWHQKAPFLHSHQRSECGVSRAAWKSNDRRVAVAHGKTFTETNARDSRLVVS